MVFSVGTLLSNTGFHLLPSFASPSPPLLRTKAAFSFFLQLITANMWVALWLQLHPCDIRRLYLCMMYTAILIVVNAFVIVVIMIVVNRPE